LKLLHRLPHSVVLHHGLQLVIPSAWRWLVAAVSDISQGYAPADFSRHHDAADAARVQEANKDAWRISDDRVIGGYSHSSAVFLRSQREYDRHIQHLSGENQVNSSEEGPTNDDNVSDYDLAADLLDTDQHYTAFLRWEGTLDTSVGLQSQAHRSGFAALRSPEFAFSGANLQGLYNALEISCRSDGRFYTLNLKVASPIPDDIYQHHFSSRTAANEGSGATLDRPFDKIILPFSNFGLTAMGREREVHRELDNNICVESIGITLMDGQDGDFAFDLCRIRAVNVLENRDVYEGVHETETAFK
jgi:hypothetical protein